MPDVASANVGGQVVMVTSLDEDHPGDNVIDGSNTTFWMSTGLYPQEILLLLPQPAVVSSVRLSCTQVREVRIEGCVEDNPVNFKMMMMGEIQDNQGALQTSTMTSGNHDLCVRYVRVLILSGWHDFCSVHRVFIDGHPVPGSASSKPSAAQLETRRGSKIRASSNTRLSECALGLEISIPSREPPQDATHDEPGAPRVHADESAWKNTS
eukprot:TRINITY_DN57236_c0_g1_i1.p1 TRINITY_DN57236_c0_g1~~TRINITY_DN57236_c0_g1_i1.p1  ORF type:complete len:210 (+),score=25.86 TRINITY_DN57236_c0_g1_i1:313-942(+)